MSELFDLDARFQGGLSIDGEREPVSLRCDERGLHAQRASGELFSIPWHELRLRLGGSSGSVVFCEGRRGEGLVDCEHPDFLHALEGAGGNELADELARLEGQRVSSNRRHSAIWAATLALLALAIWATPKLFRATVDSLVASLPYSVDESIGEAAESQMPVEGRLIEEGLVLAALEEMVARLQAGSARPEAHFELRLIESETTNAFALPGGRITVFTGLLRHAERPEQVAGVLAHEMSHVTLRHGLSRIAHSVGVMVGLQLLLGDTSGLLGLAGDLFTMATVNSYSREQEAEADAEGVRMMIAAHIDPRALADFFELLEGEEGEAAPVLSWMSTHPEFRERIASIQAQLAAAPAIRAEPFDFDWQAVRRELEAEDGN